MHIIHSITYARGRKITDGVTSVNQALKRGIGQPKSFIVYLQNSKYGENQFQVLNLETLNRNSQLYCTSRIVSYTSTQTFKQVQSQYLFNACTTIVIHGNNTLELYARVLHVMVT